MGDSRGNRRSRKAVDYSHEQEFSDDAFEDEATAQAMVSPVVGSRSKQSRASTGRRKKKKGDEDEDDNLSEVGTGRLLAAYQQPSTSGPRYVEKGYPSDLPPITERYLYLPEIEEDGSPRIELIVGRRPMQAEERVLDEDENDEDADTQSNMDAEESEADNESEAEESDEEGSPKKSGRRGARKRQASRKMKSPAKKKAKVEPPSSTKATTTKSKTGSPSKPLLSKATEYEYLIKYRGRSYLHLDWKTASDLESLNKSAKTLYRRFIKKLEAGTVEGLEDPTVDPSFIDAEKIVDEKDEEIMMELTDRELLNWEKEREKEIAQEEEDAKAELALAAGESAAAENGEEKVKKEAEEAANGTLVKKEEPIKKEESDAADKAANGEVEVEVKPDEATSNEEEKKAEDDLVLDIERPITDIEIIRKIIAKDGPYYPVIKGSDNPYRDGYITEPPKKPRASYLFFQTVYRGAYNKRFPEKSQPEVMILLGDTWRAYSESEQAPFIQLAAEETAQFEREKQMLEKAQRPNELWQPLRRCKQVLDRLSSDSFAQIFLEPVDTRIFTDYNMYVEKPMDLGTIRKNLANRKYQMPENFARDLRKVWQNCKVYNQHGSAIWFVADYMSKQFERLYHAWVLAFRNRYLRWAHPKARPWEITCREHEWECPEGDDDSKSLMCDHCDATYGMKCLKPPLKEPPSGPWHCPECTNLIAHNERVRNLSAMSEAAARRRAELGDTPRKLVKRKMFLVKWSGLGYEFCTWETKEDINDDALIAAYRKINGMSPDEPDLSQELVEETLAKATHVTPDTAVSAADAAGLVTKGTAASNITMAKNPASSIIPELKTQLYAQTRALQFTRFGSSLPPQLSNEIGPMTKSIVHCGKQQHPLGEGDSDSNNTILRHAVGETLHDLVFRVSRGETQSDLLFSGMNPLLYGEYDSIIPITHKGLMMNVGEISGSVAFLGYRQFPDGTKGPSEVRNLVRGIGDKIIAVDGVSTAGKSFKQVIDLLRESGKNKFCYMRFYETRLRIGDTHLTSTGALGKYVFAKLSDKFKLSRRILIADRKAKLHDEDNAKKGKDEEEDSDKSVDEESMEESDSDDSNASYSDEDGEMDAEDRQLMLMNKNRSASATPASTPGSVKSESSPEKSVVKTDTTNTPDKTPSSSNGGVPVKTPDTSAKSKGGGIDNKISSAVQEKVNVDVATHLIKRETTRSLALNLLDVDVGYSSDEGGDEDRAWFLDGVDCTFSSNTQAFKVVHGIDTAEALALAAAEDDEEGSDNDEKGSDNDEDGHDFKSSAAKKAEKEKKQLRKDEKEAAAKAAKGSNDILVKKNEFMPLGEKSKLLAAAMCSKQEADASDFDNFPLPSTKALALIKEEEELAAKLKAEQEASDKAAAEALAAGKSGEASKDGASDKPALSGIKSTTKVEQVSVDNNEVLRVWTSVAEAAATLQISLSDIQAVLTGEYNEDIGDEAGGYKWRYADENAQVTAKVTMKNRSKKGREAYLQFRDKLYDHAKPHEYKAGHKLRDYQIDGVNWLASCWYKRVGCILADEMGLGKTVQIVTYVEHLYRVEQIRGPFLIVVPLSTVEHWRREVEGWTDMRCCVYHDRQREWRDVMREYEWYFKDRPHTSEYLKYDILITTYDTLIADFDILGSIPWRVAVVDEAHRLRNVKGKLLECMKQISQRGTLQYGYQSRVLMTGTPLQNNTQELWTLLNFIEPFVFPSVDEFMYKFGNMANQEQVQNLQAAIAPFMLRRVKEDVAKDIPSKEETLIDVELTSIQKQYYRAIFEHNHTFLNMGAQRNNAPKLMNIQMELRKCCNHPFLLDGIEQRELEKQHSEFLESGALNGMSLEDQHNKVHEMGYIKSSGKMVLLDKLLPKLRSEGHKVLIFSQMVKMLDLISEFCDFRGFRHERLDGSIRGNERQKAIDRYNTEEDSFVFLLSTRAGGVGINLTAADICIIFDSDWNPQNDVQAQARCHRIGQTRDVMIYRLITSKTFEQEMFDRASKKLGLEQAVLGTFGQEDEDGKPTTQEMEQLLKKGAYALMDEDDQDAKQFDEDDIEDILAKRTRTRVVEGAKTSSWLNKSGLNVTKSKFTAEGADAAVDLNDPMFWQKIMPDFVTVQLLWNKLKDLIDSYDQRITGVVKPKGVGRGKGRWAKKHKAAAEAKALTDGTDDAPPLPTIAEPEPEPEAPPMPAVPLITGPTKTDVKKVRQFMADLDSLMDDVYDQLEDDTLSQQDKMLCQKMLLTISIKEKLFTNEQRSKAKALMSRLEGDRRRRCRTSDVGAGKPKRARARGTGGGIDDHLVPEVAAVNEALLIQSSKKKRGKKQQRRGKFALNDEDADSDEDADADDDDADDSDDPYSSGNKGRRLKSISLKEAKRRKAWGTGKDQTKAAGRPWPAIPRHMMKPVLKDMINEVIKIDSAKDGLFSEPVPKDVFPDYYQVVQHPMDYSTIKQKLEDGDYRSAQQVQKDFLLVMQNCIKYNSAESDIVKEARTQALAMPGLLREAGFKHQIFIGDDGTVMEIVNEDDKKNNKLKIKTSDGDRDRDEKDKKGLGPGRGRKKGSKNKPKESKDDEDGDDDDGSNKKKSRKRKSADNDEADEDAAAASQKKKPRIRISLNPTTKKASKAESDEDSGEDSDAPRSGMAKKVNKRRSAGGGKAGNKQAVPKKGSRKSNGKTGLESPEDVKKKRTRKASSKKAATAEATEDEEDDDTDTEEATSSARVRSSGPSIPRKNRSAKKAEPQPETEPADSEEEGEVNEEGAEEGEEEGNENGEVAEEEEEGEAAEEEGEEEEESQPAEEHVDKAAIKARHDELIDGTFRSSRTFFAERGEWTLPPSVEESSSYTKVKATKEVAKMLLQKMKKLDQYSLFAQPVKDEEAPDYSTTVTHPMDFGTIKTKVDKNQYAAGTALEGMYHDILLTMDNCALYNDEDSEVATEAARIMSLLPETFASACLAVGSSGNNKGKKGGKR